MSISVFNKALFSTVLFLLVVWDLQAQTQEDFMKKVGDVYVNAGDEKKALEIAKELLRMVEQHKELQTYANYYVLKTHF